MSDSMRLTALANGNEDDFKPTLDGAIEAYEARDAGRIATWERVFGSRSQPPAID